MYTRKAPPVFGPDTPTNRTSIAVDPGCLAATRMQTFAECVRLQPQRTDLWRTRWSVSARDIWMWWGTLSTPTSDAATMEVSVATFVSTFPVANRMPPSYVLAFSSRLVRIPQSIC
jgi:hypothetical protein